MNIYQFYVIILNNIVEQGRLPLPSSFPEELNNELGDYVTIRSHAGMCSTIIVEKSNDGRLYLGGDGWAEFAARHSLSFGNFLLFKCKRPYYFKVFIFDQTATKIDYPTPDFDSQSSNVHSQFDKRMTASDIIRRQTIGIPLPFIRENWSTIPILLPAASSMLSKLFTPLPKLADDSNPTEKLLGCFRCASSRFPPLGRFRYGDVELIGISILPSSFQSLA